MGAFRKFMSAVTVGAVAPYSTAEKQLIRMNARAAGAIDRELRYAGV